MFKFELKLDIHIIEVHDSVHHKKDRIAYRSREVKVTRDMKYLKTHLGQALA